MEEEHTNASMDEEEQTERSERRHSHSQGDREMHKATCSECGKDCEVPFKPAEERPVYCQDCYRNRRRPRRH